MVISWLCRSYTPLRPSKALEAVIHEIFEELLDRIREASLLHYGARLKSLAVFGSVARATERPDSDIDLLIVAEPLPAGRMKRVQEFAEVECGLGEHLAVAAKKGVRTELSPIFKTPEELEIGSFLLLDFVDQARILYDPQQVLEHRLDRLRLRLEELGARRVRRGGGYYWLLKPDLKPGERIEL